MPETIIESVLNGKLDSELLIKWLNDEPIEDDCILLCCKKSEFVSCFLSYLRNQTDSILLTNSNAVQILHNSTPEKIHSSRRKHHRSISEPTSDDRDSISVKTEKCHESPNRDRKRSGRKVKTKLFPDDRRENLSVSSDESRLSTSVDKIAISSTPLKNGVKPSDYPNLSISSPVTPRSFIKEGERCDTPRLSHRHSRSHEKSCLGDFLVTATKSSKKKTKKNISSENEDKIELDLSNSEMFPEIGARKSSSLRGEKKRIKPTNIDKSQKSLSLNSFSSEHFQQLSPLEDNSAFKQKFQPKETTNSFEVERNILKQERHKLMEKFNILSTSSPQKVAAVPQIKLTPKDIVEVSQTYVTADVTKILLKDKIDLLINIYDNLLKNNQILSIITEIYFLISLVISKQIEDDYMNVELNLNESNTDYLLKSIHNSSYFAVKSLWNLRLTLEVILDKNSLKTLGENKKVRNFYADLAKFLLNCYCVRCEKPTPLQRASAPSVVCYNTETDSADNFPTTQAFHYFKKQRDMFYEIVRWYAESQSSNSTGVSNSGFRARVKALCAGGAHAHLATLTVQHCMQATLFSAQESKISKLQRRLTCPAAPESHRLPSFSANEIFYKEFITHAENESFRIHLRDVLCTEIVTSDGTQFAVENGGNDQTSESEERVTNKRKEHCADVMAKVMYRQPAEQGRRPNVDITREYLQLAKKLALLAKLLGYLTSLPYSPAPTEIISKNNNIITLNKEQNYTIPKEKVLENNLALRSYSQPTIDIKSLLQNAIDNGRIAITIPWIVHYLSMLDYTTLHLPYYQNILKTLLEVYHTKLTLTQENNLKKNTIIYLKSLLGWLFDLPHFSETETIDNSVGTDSIDSCDLVDESIFELCPCLRDVNTLLSTCRLSNEQKDVGSFRHITPVSLNVDPQARSRNKEKELQARLEEELVKSQPSSTRRVLEMVIERVTSAAVRELTARELVAARTRASEQVQRTVSSGKGTDHATLLTTVTAIYTSTLSQLRAAALEGARAPLATRTRAALTALLPQAPPHLQSVACRAARNRLSKWINDHWNTTAVLCKDIESEMKSLLFLSEMRVPCRTPTLLSASLCNYDESPATVLIHMKEHICLLLDGDTNGDLTPTLTACASAASTTNVFCRAPTQRALLQLTLDLCLLYVSKRPKEVTEAFLLKLHTIWNTCCPDRKHYTPENVSMMERREDLSPELRNVTDDRIPTPISDEETESDTVKTEKIDQNAIVQDSNSIEQDSNSIEQNSQSFDANLTDNSLKQSLKSPVPKTDQNKFVASTPLKRITPITIKTKSVNKLTINTKLSESRSSDNKSESKQSDSKSDQINMTIEETNEHLLEYFDRILCPRNIVMLSVSKCKQSDVWEALANMIVFLLKKDYLSEDSLTEQCLAVYRQDWTQSILENLSSCMKAVSARWSRSSTGKFTLFLDFLAEYCGDMDYDVTE